MLETIMFEMAKYQTDTPYECASLPFIEIEENNLKVKMFIYEQTPEYPKTITCFDKMLTYMQEKVYVENLNLNCNIVIDDCFQFPKHTTREEYLANIRKIVDLEQEYYNILQNLIKNYTTNQDMNFDALRTTFLKLVSNKQLELYRQMCPKFLKMLNIE
jgi:hypothetical protein